MEIPDRRRTRHIQSEKREREKKEKGVGYKGEE